MKAFITVIGEDKVGIIAELSRLLAADKVNILDINQTVMEEMFTMIMMVDLARTDAPFSELAGRLEEAGERLKLSVRIQREDIFHSMHRI